MFENSLIQKERESTRVFALAIVQLGVREAQELIMIQLMKVRVFKWGNSLAVCIPRVAADAARLKEGDAVEVTACEEGKLEVRRVSKVPSLSKLAARITLENRHGEISSAGNVGKEPVEW